MFNYWLIIHSMVAHIAGNSNHWVCVHCQGDGVVELMDSLGSFMPLGRMTLLQIASIFKGPSEYLKLRILPVQQQQGVLDCGLFAIAYATEVCARINPVQSVFNQKLMRKHLTQCLLAGVICPFPQRTDLSPLTELPRPTCRLLSVKLYCYCLMPDNYDKNMILCDRCKKWYHYSCVGINKKNIPKTWKCARCTGKDFKTTGVPTEFSLPTRK